MKSQGNLPKEDDSTLMNEVQRKPLYLAALTANNLPGDTWGPRRRVHQYGVYAHLLKSRTNNNIPSELVTGVTNPTFNSDLPVNNNGEQDLNTNF